MQLVTNLNFDGNCEEAFTFYAQALSGELSEFNRYSGMPADPATPLDPVLADKIMHVSLSKNGQMILMGADVLSVWLPDGITVGNNMEICIMADTKEEADQFFANLSTGGTVSMPMENQFWGDYYGSCRDKYNIGWMILCPGVQ